MSIRTLVNTGLASLMLATAPIRTLADEPATREINQFFNGSEEYKEGLDDYISGLEMAILAGGEPITETPENTKWYYRHRMTDEEINKTKNHLKADQLKRYEVPPYLGFVTLMRYKPLIDFVASYYKLDPMQILEVMNHETAFDIRTRGESGERGIGQKMKATAWELVKNVSNPNHELYYPFLEKEDYRFWKLSSDYRLNIILTAAMIRTAHSDLDHVLEDNEITREELAEKVRELGQKDSFWYLKHKKSEKFKHYDVSNKLRERINKFWKENTVNTRDLYYLIYNGGMGVIENLFRKMAVSEVLQINFYNYNRRMDEVEKYFALYNGYHEAEENSLEDMENIISEEMDEF